MRFHLCEGKTATTDSAVPVGTLDDRHVRYILWLPFSRQLATTFWANHYTSMIGPTPEFLNELDRFPLMLRRRWSCLPAFAALLGLA